MPTPEVSFPTPDTDNDAVNLLYFRKRTAKVVAVQTDQYNASVGEFVPCDTTTPPPTTGRVDVYMPDNPDDGSYVGVKMVATDGVHQVLIHCQGADTINGIGGVVSRTINAARLNESYEFIYRKANHGWYVVSNVAPIDELITEAVAASQAAGPGAGKVIPSTLGTITDGDTTDQLGAGSTIRVRQIVREFMSLPAGTYSFRVNKAQTLKNPFEESPVTDANVAISLATLGITWKVNNSTQNGPGQNASAADLVLAAGDLVTFTTLIKATFTLKALLS